MNKENYTYITLINTDKYLNGALCLFESLKKVKSKYPFSVLITDGVSEESENVLREYDINVIKSARKVHVPSEVLKKNIQENMNHWNYSFDKLLVFELTEFDKLIFIDSDMYILENIDHLFEKDHMSGVILGESFPKDYYSSWTRTQLSSGLMVIVPQEGIIEEFENKFGDLLYYNGAIGDQQIIWEYYSKWPSDKHLHLPERYTVCYEHLEYYIKNFKYDLYNKKSENNIATVHFAAPKPWLIDKKLRLKYVIYQFIKRNFGIARLLIDYFLILRNIEKNNINQQKN